VAGRLLMGAVSDRTGRRLTLAAGLGLQTLAFAALASSRSLGGLYVAASLFGFSYGSVSVLFPALVTDFFGRQHAGAIVGVLFAFAGSAAAWGPLAAGWLYDRLGSYTLAWWLSAGFNALALLLIAFTRPPPPGASGGNENPTGA
jgi:MFS family permease